VCGHNRYKFLKDGVDVAKVNILQGGFACAPPQVKKVATTGTNSKTGLPPVVSSGISLVQVSHNIWTLTENVRENGIRY